MIGEQQAGGVYWQMVGMALHPGLSEDKISPLSTRPGYWPSSFRLRVAPLWSLTGEGELGEPPMGVAAHAVVWCSGNVGKQC